MNVVDKFLNIICKNESVEVSISAEDYNIYSDEITIRSIIRYGELTRGWIGDLTCSTIKTYAQQGNEVDNVFRETYHEVLLASVTPDHSDDCGYVSWNYRFLKK